MDELLLQIYGEEQLKVVVTCLETLSAFNLVNVWPEIEVILQDSDSVDSYGKKPLINSLLRDSLTEVLNQHWVFTTQNTPLAILDRITYCMFDSVTNYEPTQILDAVPLVVSDENPAKDALANLVEFLYDLPTGVVLENLTLVDDTLIKNIHIALSQKVIPDLPVVDTQYKDRYLAYVGATRKGIVYNYIVAGGVIGGLSAYSLILVMDELFDNLTTDELVFEAASLILVSNDELTPNVIDQVAQFITTDPIVRDKLVSTLIKDLGVNDGD